MKARGSLIVFEGADGVGKTTIAQALYRHCQSHKIASIYKAFPGNQPGTLGYLVYDVHHNIAKYGIEKITPISLQLLHIAAHVDEIASRIRPALAEGYNLILDRFWWSTWIYGIIAGADPELLRCMIEIETQTWAEIKPACLILVDRENSLRQNEVSADWQNLRSAYLDLFEAETDKYPLAKLNNDGSVQYALDNALKILNNCGVA